jgi:hypothetical protein
VEVCGTVVVVVGVVAWKAVVCGTVVVTGAVVW